MTRQHFELIASSLKQSFEDVRDFNMRASKQEIDEIQTHVVLNIAQALGETNALFDTQRFIKACGVELSNN
jgi:hypothetical protein